MSKAGLFMFKRDTREAIGVFATEDAAKQAALDGEYVIVPIEAGRVYADMRDESLPGAVVHVAKGFETRISKNELDISNLDQRLTLFKAGAQTQIASLLSRISALETESTDHENRIAALEAP